MSVTATRTYITPDLLSRPLGDFISSGYGELFFVSEEAPMLTPALQQARDQAMKEYDAGESIDLETI